MKTKTDFLKSNDNSCGETLLCIGDKEQLHKND